MSIVKRETHKIAVVGAGGVGKSAMRHMFRQEYDPTVEDSYMKRTTIDNRPVDIEIIDTAGEEEYRGIRAQYMRASVAFVLVLDSTDTRSVTILKEFIEQIKHIKGEKFTCVLACNKVDLVENRQVSIEEVKDLSESHLWSCPFFDVSAKTRYNVDECFSQLIREIRSELGDNLFVTPRSESISTPFIEQPDQKKSSFWKSMSESENDIEFM